tara:strand:- start:7102 stop:8832 length:1731 start_codon:yes stop_codon:yes gene_type:complete
MKKIRLVGKKLYRTGPLKLFKGYGNPGESTYQSTNQSTRSVGTSHPGEGAKPGGQVQVNVTRPPSRGGNRGGGFNQQQQQQVQQQRRIAAEKHLAKMKKDADDLINDNSPEGKQKLINAREFGDPNLQKAVNDRLNEIEGQKTGAARQKKLDEKVSQNQLKNLLKKVVRGTIVKVGKEVGDAYDIIRDNPDNTTVNKLIDALGVGRVDPSTITVSDEEVQKELATGNYDNPENPNKFEGSPSQTQAAAKPKPRSGGGGPSPTINIGDLPSGKTTLPSGAAQPAAPAAPAPPSAMEQLQRRARGEDSIVEKEAKLARDRALSSQLAAIKGARGATAGQKLRALRRGQEDVGLKLGAQTAIEKAKERKEAQDKIIGYDEAQKERDLRLAMAKEKGTSGVGLGAAPSPGQSFGDKLKTGLDILKKGKTIWKEFKGIKEGGFVSGPGSETSDSIPARLSDGEFVVKASAVRGLGKQLGAKDKGEERQKGVDFLYKLQDKMDKAEKFAKGGEAYVRPKKAFREAIGYEPESRFHDKAEKDAKFGGARRKFRHFKQGGEVSFGSVVSAKKRLNKNLEKLKRK